MEVAVQHQLMHHHAGYIGSRLLAVQTVYRERLFIISTKAVYPLYGEHAGGAIAAVHLRYFDEVERLHLMAEALRVLRLDTKVQFVEQIVAELLDLSRGVFAAQPGVVALSELHSCSQDLQIGAAGVFGLGALNLDGDQFTRVQAGPVHLRQRAACYRFLLELCEKLVHIGAQLFDYDLLDLAKLTRADSILQNSQFGHILMWQQVATRTEHLAELDRSWPQLFQCHAQPHRCLEFGCLRVRSAGDAVRQNSFQPIEDGRESETDQHAGYVGQAGRPVFRAADGSVAA